MANQFYQKMGKGGGGSNKAQGSKPSIEMPERNGAKFGGLPGPTQKARQSGTPTSGRGPFAVKKLGL